MIFSFYGVVRKVYHGHIIVSVSDFNFELLVSHITDYKIDEKIEIYLYQVLKEDENYLIGFKTLNEKEAFLDLIKVKGVGPKSAINILSYVSPSELYGAIESGDTSIFKRVKGIGKKTCAQIILDLKGQLNSLAFESGNPHFVEAKKALLSLGFKAKEIDDTLSTIDKSINTTEEILTIALRKTKKNNGRLIS